MNFINVKNRVVLKLLTTSICKDQYTYSIVQTCKFGENDLHVYITADRCFMLTR